MTDRERDEMIIRIDERVNSMQADLKDIYKEVRTTNGRVTKIETKIATEDAKVNTVFKVSSVVWGFLIALISAGASVATILMIFK